jgi:hypothetical protein
LALAECYVASDFSLLNVYENSNSAMPLTSTKRRRRNPPGSPNDSGASYRGGALTATTMAQSSEKVLEPRRPCRGGSNPAPKNPGRIQLFGDR